MWLTPHAHGNSAAGMVYLYSKIVLLLLWIRNLEKNSCDSSGVALTESREGRQLREVHEP